MKKIIVLLCISFLLLQNDGHAQGWTQLEGANPLRVNTEIESICSDPAGNIYAVSFVNDSNFVNKYDGNGWSRLGGSNPFGHCVLETVCADPAGNIYTAGGLANASYHQYVAKYDGATWSELGGLDGLSANSTIKSIFCDASGNVYAGGIFKNDSNNIYVAIYNGNSWSELGGLNGLKANDIIYSICGDPFGNIYAAGNFRNDSGCAYVAKYDGTSWAELGGTNSSRYRGGITSICSDSSGNIYAATGGTVKKYDGLTWTQFPNPLLYLGGTILSIMCDKAQSIYAGYGQNHPGVHQNYVLKYSGSSCIDMNINANNMIVTLCSDPSGYIYAAGAFTDGSGHYYVAKYDAALSVPEINNINAISVTPNPVYDKASISWDNRIENSTVRIMNPLGQIVFEKRELLGHLYTFDASELPCGLYFLELKTPSITWTQKILKPN